LFTKEKQMETHWQRSKLHGSKPSHKKFSYFTRFSEYIGPVYSMAIIAVTVVRIPNTIRGYIDYLKNVRDKKVRELVWSKHNPKVLNINIIKLPAEINFEILKYLDPTSLCRVIQTCTKMAKLGASNQLWIEKIVADWPDFSTKSHRQRLHNAQMLSIRFYNNYRTLYRNVPKLDFITEKSILKSSKDGQKECPQALLFYRQRYISFKRYSFEEVLRLKRQETTFYTVLKEQREKALGNSILFILSLKMF
jgi:hypothetical protein